VTAAANEFEIGSASASDVACVRTGPFEFFINHAHPPHRTWAVAVGQVIACFVAFMLLVVWSHYALGQLGQSLVAGSGGLCGAFAGACREVVWRRSGRRRDSARIGELVAGHVRATHPPLVRIRGRAAELVEFVRLHEFGFEPQFFRSASRQVLLKMEGRTAWLVIAAILIAAILVSGRGRTLWWLLAFIVLPMMALLLVGLFRRPSFCRVVPGRLDMLDFMWNRDRAHSFECINLQKARLMIDLTRDDGYICIVHGRLVCRLNRSDTYDPLRFALAIAHAAICREPTPSIPMDRLLG